jgi:hypothetical protein
VPTKPAPTIAILTPPSFLINQTTTKITKKEQTAAIKPILIRSSRRARLNFISRRNTIYKYLMGMPEPDPQEHHDFLSNGGYLKVNLPLVLDEHENTHITVYNLDKTADLNLKILTTGALVLQKNDPEIRDKIAKNGNDSFSIHSPAKYEYPSGTEGECVAQVNICFTKLEIISEEEVASDSLSVDLYIRRKLLNVFTAIWKSANGLLANIGSSAIFTSIVAIATFFMGSNLATLVPDFATLFIAFALLFSVVHSWNTRNKFLKARLDSNSAYQGLVTHAQLNREASQNVH